MTKTIKWLAAGLVFAPHGAFAAQTMVTLPSGDTVAVVQPTLSASEMEQRLQKAIDALTAVKAPEQKAEPPAMVTSPPVMTGYSLYPR